MSHHERVVESFEDLKNMARDSYTTGKKEAVKSGKDWVAYIEKHPLQTMLFGIIGYFAIKGMLD